MTSVALLMEGAFTRVALLVAQAAVVASGADDDAAHAALAARCPAEADVGQGGSPSGRQASFIETRRSQAGRDAHRASRRRGGHDHVDGVGLDEDAHAVLAVIETFHDWDWAAASASSRRALELEPGDSGIMSVAASLARVMGRFDEAIALYKRIIEVDPLHTNAYKNFGITLFYVGRYEEAKTYLQKAFEQLPSMAYGHFYLALIDLMQSRPNDALAEAQMEKDPSLRQAALTVAYYALGRKSESDTTLAQLTAEHDKDAPYQIAEVYAFRGETEQAFAWLERAYALHDDSLPEIKGDPILRRLQSDPRYAALLRKMRLPL